MLIRHSETACVLLRSPFKFWFYYLTANFRAFFLTIPNRKTHTKQLLIRHSETVNGNAELKQKINHLRKERTTTNEVHASYEASILQLRGDITSLMAQASAVNDHREELVKTREVTLLGCLRDIKFVSGTKSI